MRIVLVCRVYPTQRPGGMPHVIQDRAEALVAMRHEVHVLTTGNPIGKCEFVNGVDVHHLECPPGRYSEAFARLCGEACRALKPKIVHLDGFDTSNPWWLDRPGDPSALAVTLHGFGMGAFLTAWNLFRSGESAKQPEFNAGGMAREAYLLRDTFDAVLGISQHEHWMLADCYGVKQAKLVYNPIAPYFFEDNRKAVPPEAPFLCAAVSGHGTRGFRFAELAAQKAGKSLFVASSIERRKMPYIIDDAAAVVIPTFYAQGFDLTVAEAFARGRPVIASATGSYLREANDFAPYLRTVPIGDVDALAAEMAAPLPEVPLDVSLRFQPDNHAKAWLEAIWPWGD